MGDAAMVLVVLTVVSTVVIWGYLKSKREQEQVRRRLGLTKR